jgi:hypothetical protein
MGVKARKRRQVHYDFADAILMMRRWLGVSPTKRFSEAQLQRVRKRLRSDEKLSQADLERLQAEAIGSERHPERFRSLLLEAARHAGESWTLAPRQVEIVFQALYIATVEHEPAAQRSVQLSEREDKERWRRGKGGSRAAQKRHKKHQEKRDRYREQYRKRLEAAAQEYPRDSLPTLSPKIIRSMAKELGETERNMREIVRPREMQKDIRRRPAST